MNITAIAPYSYNDNTNFKSSKNISKTLKTHVKQCAHVGETVKGTIEHITPLGNNIKQVKLVGNTAWGTKIQIGDNPDLLLQVKQEDYEQITHPMCMFSRILGNDGLFQFSIEGTDKKVKIKVPAQELTQEMKIVDISMQAETHPFLKDMAAFLNAHPELIAEIEKI